MIGYTLSAVFGVVVVVGCVRGQEQGHNYGPPPAANTGNGGGLLVPANTGGQMTPMDPLQMLLMGVPGGGVPGEDYPILSSVPDTGFTCEDQELPGYYADTADEAGCQVFHICQIDGHLDSFLCPNGTIFNQQYFVCNWWFNVDCAASEQFFDLNSQIGVIPEKTDAPDTPANGASQNGAPQGIGLPQNGYKYEAPPTPPSGQGVEAPASLYGTPTQ